MTLEKLWRKPYQKLIGELTEQWGGKVIDPSENDRGGFLQAPPGMFEYPRFFADIEEFHLRVESSELPFLGASFLEGADNYEYLRISASTDTDTKMSLAVRHEGFYDRMKKALRLEWEYQTGYEEFDKKYFILADHRGHPERLRDSAIQQAIMAMEPFEGI